MGEDVIELAVGGVGIAEIGDAQIEIGERERGGGGARCSGDGLRGEIDADEAGLGKVPGERDQNAAGAAAEIQHTAPRHGSGLHAEEPGHGGEPVGMRLATRKSAVGNVIVETVWHGRTIITRRGH